MADNPSLNDNRKRKRPPTFNHLPPIIAKKRKKEWVAVKKMKSKWRAEKKRQPIGDMPDSKEGPSNEVLEEDLTKAETGSPDSRENDSEEEQPSPPPRKRARLSHFGNSPKSAEKASDLEQDEDSFREIQKRAYSRNSLHTFKSNPLHRKKGSSLSNLAQQEHGGGRTTGGRGGGSRSTKNDRQDVRRGRGAGSRGQPDMRLRMSALVEKIKRVVKT